MDNGRVFLCSTLDTQLQLVPTLRKVSAKQRATLISHGLAENLINEHSARRLFAFCNYLYNKTMGAVDLHNQKRSGSSKTQNMQRCVRFRRYTGALQQAMLSIGMTMAWIQYREVHHRAHLIAGGTMSASVENRLHTVFLYSLAQALLVFDDDAHEKRLQQLQRMSPSEIEAATADLPLYAKRFCPSKYLNHSIAHFVAALNEQGRTAPHRSPFGAASGRNTHQFAPHEGPTKVDDSRWRGEACYVCSNLCQEKDKEGKPIPNREDTPWLCIGAKIGNGSEEARVYMATRWMCSTCGLYMHPACGVQIDIHGGPYHTLNFVKSRMSPKGQSTVQNVQSNILESRKSNRARHSKPQQQNPKSVRRVLQLGGHAIPDKAPEPGLHVQEGHSGHSLGHGLPAAVAQSGHCQPATAAVRTSSQAGTYQGRSRWQPQGLRSTRTMVKAENRGVAAMELSLTPEKKKNSSKRAPYADRVARPSPAKKTCPAPPQSLAAPSQLQPSALPQSQPPLQSLSSPQSLPAPSQLQPSLPAPPQSQPSLQSLSSPQSLPAPPQSAKSIASRGGSPEHEAVLRSLENSTIWANLLIAYDGKVERVIAMLTEASKFIKSNKNDAILSGGGHCQLNANWRSSVEIVIGLNAGSSMTLPGAARYQRLLVDYGAGSCNVLFAAVILTGVDVIGIELDSALVESARTRAEQLKKTGIGLTAPEQRLKLQLPADPIVDVNCFDLLDCDSQQGWWGSESILRNMTKMATHIYVCSKTFSAESLCIIFAGIAQNSKFLLSIAMASSPTFNSFLNLLPLNMLRSLEVMPPDGSKIPLSYRSSNERFHVVVLRWCPELYAFFAGLVLEQLDVLKPPAQPGQIGHDKLQAACNRARGVMERMKKHLSGLPDRCLEAGTPFPCLPQLHLEDHLRRLAKLMLIPNDHAGRAKLQRGQALEVSTTVSELLSPDAKLDLLLKGSTGKDATLIQFKDYGSRGHNCGYHVISEYLHLDWFIEADSTLRHEPGNDMTGLRYLRAINAAMLSLLSQNQLMDRVGLNGLLAPRVFRTSTNPAELTLADKVDCAGLDMHQLNNALASLVQAVRRDGGILTATSDADGREAKDSVATLSSTALLSDRSVLFMSLAMGFGVHICTSMLESPRTQDRTIIHFGSLEHAGLASDTALQLFTLLHDHVLKQARDQGDHRFVCLEGLPVHMRLIEPFPTDLQHYSIAESFGDPARLKMCLIDQHWVRVDLGSNDRRIAARLLQPPIDGVTLLNAFGPDPTHRHPATGFDDDVKLLSTHESAARRLVSLHHALCAAIAASSPTLEPDGKSKDRTVVTHTLRFETAATRPSATVAQVAKVLGGILATFGICALRENSGTLHKGSSGIPRFSWDSTGDMHPIGPSNIWRVADSVTIMYVADQALPSTSTAAVNLADDTVRQIATDADAGADGYWRLIMHLRTASPDAAPADPVPLLAVPPDATFGFQSLYVIDKAYPGCIRPVHSSWKLYRQVTEPFAGHTVIIVSFRPNWLPCSGGTEMGIMARSVGEMWSHLESNQLPVTVASMSGTEARSIGHAAAIAACSPPGPTLARVQHSLSTPQSMADETSINYCMRAIWWGWNLVRRQHCAASSCIGLSTCGTRSSWAFAQFDRDIELSKLSEGLVRSCKGAHLNCMFMPIFNNNTEPGHWALLLYNCYTGQASAVDSVQPPAHILIDSRAHIQEESLTHSSLFNRVQTFCAALDQRVRPKQPKLPVSLSDPVMVIKQNPEDTWSCGWIMLLHFADHLARSDSFPGSPDALGHLPVSERTLSYIQAVGYMKAALLASLTHSDGIFYATMIPSIASRVQSSSL